MSLYPLKFIPRFKERVWGGRKLEQLYGKSLPSSVPFGESWEITDRPGDVSVIQEGPLKGRTLRWLLDHHPAEVLGAFPAQNGHFPLLIKLLDAREKLSLQVHPPADKALALGGEPKTEMWFIADADPGARLYVGLKNGVTRAEFDARLRSGSVEECFHQIPVSPGDAMFLPSGRVHAIGAGLVLFEIQQNSDTTFRVFDWNRLGLDGKPRQLHVQESLESIDFQDFEPALVPRRHSSGNSFRRPLVRDPLFDVDACEFASEHRLQLASGEMHVLGVVHGALVLKHAGEVIPVSPGEFVLIPAAVKQLEVVGQANSLCLHVAQGGSLNPATDF